MEESVFEVTSDIIISDLKKSYHGAAGQPATVVLDGLSMQIKAGELIALVGPSGCGKSTVLNLIADLEKPSGGEVRFEGGTADVELSVVFQQPRLLDWLTVEENVSIVFERNGRAAINDRKIVDGLLAKVELREHRRSFPQFLSGGQKQRVAIARAFAIRPDVLLLDEPFSALDELTARRLRLLLQSLWIDEQHHRPTGILVTHNMLEAAFLADRIYVMGGQPAKVSAVIDVDRPRPRDPDDPALFEVHRAIMRALG